MDSGTFIRGNKLADESAKDAILSGDMMNLTCNEDPIKHSDGNQTGQQSENGTKIITN